MLSPSKNDSKDYVGKKLLFALEIFDASQVCTAITSFLTQLVGHQWKVYEESPMSRTGLILRPVPVARVTHALGQTRRESRSW
jgi:hypothetical protein